MKTATGAILLGSRPDQSPIFSRPLRQPKTVYTRGLNPFRTAVSFWGQSIQKSSSLSPNRDCGSKRVLLEPQSRFGDKPVKFQVVCPSNVTAVLKGLNVCAPVCEDPCYRRSRELSWALSRFSPGLMRGVHSKQDQNVLVKIAKHIRFLCVPQVLFNVVPHVNSPLGTPRQLLRGDHSKQQTTRFVDFCFGAESTIFSVLQCMYL